MKKSQRTIIIVILAIVFIVFILPVVSFFAIFRYTWFPDPVKQRKASIYAEKNAEEAWDEAASYLEDHFDDLDEDDIVDAMWAPCIMQKHYIFLSFDVVCIMRADAVDWLGLLSLDDYSKATTTAFCPIVDELDNA